MGRYCNQKQALHSIGYNPYVVVWITQYAETGKICLIYLSMILIELPDF